MPRLRAAVLTTLALGTTALLTASAAQAPADPGWDRAAAARYLDSRMDQWWAKAKTLRTAGGQAKCLSCHTAIPYVMARPLLRFGMGVAEPTAHETRVLDTVRLRVTHTDDSAPFYEHTEAKKAESRGVEAVLSAFVLTQHDSQGRSSQPGELTRKAMARLWATQRADGAWDWLDFGLEPYETTEAVYHGATLAAMAAGTSPGKHASADAAGTAGIAKLRAFLHDRLAAQSRFNKAWALLASAYLPGVLTPAERQAVIDDLASAQRADGGWSLADLGAWHWSKTGEGATAPGSTDAALLAKSDGYATGLVVYALKVSGQPVGSPPIAKGRTWLRTEQQPERAGDAAWAPWRAHSLNFDREHGGEKGEPWRRMFMSDLATAFAVLALH
jgi:squalene-hopene/tetraprenyl-beta-curcumene cyclase